MIDEAIETLQADFRALAVRIREDADELDRGVFPTQFDEHAAELRALLHRLASIQTELGLHATTSLNELKTGVAGAMRVKQMRSRLSEGVPPDLCLEIVQQFDNLIRLDESSAITAAQKVISLSSNFADLVDEDYERLREDVGKIFGSRIAAAAGRGALKFSGQPSPLTRNGDDGSIDSAGSLKQIVIPASTDELSTRISSESVELHMPQDGEEDTTMSAMIVGDDDRSCDTLASDQIEGATEFEQPDPVVEAVDIPKRPAELFAEYVDQLRAERKLVLSNRLTAVEATASEIRLDVTVEPDLGAIDVSAAWQLVIAHLSTRPVLSYNTALALESKTPSESASFVPSWVLKIAILGRLIESPDDEIEQEIRLILDSKMASDLEEDRSFNIPDRAKALSIILAGSLLRPALIAPNSGAKSLLQSLRYVGGAMHTLIVRVIAAAEKLRSVNIAMVRQLVSEQNSQVQSSDLQSETKTWLSTIEASNLSFAEARKIRRTWLVRDGLLELITRPVVENDSDLASDLVLLLDRIDEGYIDRKISDADSRTNKNRIEGKARRQLHETVSTAVILARRWLATIGRESDREGFARTEFAILESVVRELVPEILRELSELRAAATPILISAAACYQESLSNFQSLFTTTPSSGVSSLAVLQQGDLLETKITLSAERNTNSAVLDLSELIAAFTEHPLSFDEAFAFRLTTGNFAAAYAIVDKVANHDVERSLTMRDTLEGALQLKRRNVRDQIVSVRSHLERAFTQHVITEDQRNLMDSQIEQLLKATEQSGMLLSIEHEVAELRSQLKAATDAVTREIRAEYQVLNLATDVIESIERCLSTGLLNVAHEYLTNPSAAKQSENASLAAIDKLNQFRRIVESVTDSVSPAPSGAAVARAIADRARAHNFDFSSLSARVSATSATAYKS